MTQRYKITTQITPTLNGRYDTVAIAVPDDQGDYVRHDAVSHLTEEKTLDQHRAEFDKFATSHGLSVSKTDADLHVSHTVGWMWKAWKAARGVTE